MSKFCLPSLLLAWLGLGCSSVSEGAPPIGVEEATSLAVSPAAEAVSEPVAVIAHTPTDDAVAAHVAALGSSLTTQQMPIRRTPDEFYEVALTLPESIVLWVDSAASAVSALRKSDGTLLTRGLPPEAFFRSPYIAALAATELLELLRQTPLALDEGRRRTPDARRAPLRFRSVPKGLPSCARRRAS